jgi:hypothetical protein
MEPKSQGYTLSANSTTSGTVYFISGVGQDNTVNGRDGDQIRPFVLHCRIGLVGGSYTCLARYIIFEDLMCQAANPNVTDVLLSAAYNSVYHYQNVHLQHRFKILEDKMIPLSAGGIFASSDVRDIKLKGRMEFLNTGSTVASAGKRAVFLIVIASQADVAVQVNTRMQYYDA